MGRRPDIDGRELIIAAALKLFAEQGIDGVSIRAVNREAGLGPASVHYHFGTKEALLDAVVRSHGDSVIQATKARAQELVGSHGPFNARDLVTMIAEPYLDLLASHKHEGQAWMRVVGNLAQNDPGRILDRACAQLTWRAASKVYPLAAPETVRRAMQMCSTLLMTQLAFTKRPGKAASLDLDLMIEFLSAGLDGALRSHGRRPAHSPRAS
jgi:AcrR family transcriptional regulator